MTKLCVLLGLVLTAYHAYGAQPAESLRDGDIIFQTSRSAQSAAIQAATHSKYSHMGIVFLRRGEPYVFEAIRTVRYTPLRDWVARGAGGHYVVKRLRDAGRRLDADADARLRRAAAQFEGRPYDLTFEWSDERIYCSELVWKIYERALGVRIGPLQKLGEFDLSAAPVRAKLKERYGARIPLDEPVISPAAMFAARELVSVAEH